MVKRCAHEKSITVILGAACVILLAVMIIQVRIISLGKEGKTIVYTVPFDRGKPGASAASNLKRELVPLYGDEGVQTERLHRQWQAVSKNLSLPSFHRSRAAFV